ncbi:OmpA family protein [Myxococcus sp. MISCRS1]|uniref:OmpA family protein n=1 Tax=unclassified Myxococcus TaxID=2648731 RepID=UPI001CBEBBFA|nr:MULTISPECIES: OmpA family protein [unclassified Myxococcus]MBZ4401304.1 OmpA family protein [Myxococcus sp. AS-1-15]MCY1002706.1 OmpA family protein [Myxococcus sp. MISCRS1]BDT35725.1 OmpA family protein [Myxococcus sp. MH1]
MRPFLSLLVVVLGLVGCAAKQPISTVSTDSQPPHAPVATRPEPERPSAMTPNPDTDLHPIRLEPVYFELDSTTLRPEFRDTLTQLADDLRQRPQAKVSITGHTCELGTTEYNLALGQRRASVVRDYLRRLGVEPSRLSTLSYGEERPLSASELEKNRRAELQLSGGYLN